MSTLTIQLPDSIRAESELLSRRDGISPDQFLATAAAEKVSALKTVDFLRDEEEEMMVIADFIHHTLTAREEAAALAKIREEVMPSAGNSRCRFEAMRGQE